VSDTTELLQGTLDLLILKAVSLGPLQRLRRPAAHSADLPEPPADSAGLALPRAVSPRHQGLITSEWGESENKRKAKYYRRTAAGRRRLKEETAYWRRVSEAIGFALEAMPEDV
jgi:PadR family transcriptional regulator PadR